MEILNFDALVCGGGMSGMACAAFATQAGAKVLVVEKEPEVGGSSNLSAGMFWAPTTYEKLRSWVPNGDPILQRAWLEDYLPAVQWMRNNGVPTAKRFDGVMTIGSGFPIDIPHLHRLHLSRIESGENGSRLLTRTAVVKLIQGKPTLDGSRIQGAIICQQNPESPPIYYEVRSKLVVLATGGFQGSPHLTATHLGPACDRIFVRSNLGSVGDGLSLAMGVGADTSRGMDTFYGHLLPAPLLKEEVDPKDYLALAQYQSKYCLLLNESGRRFTDETAGDEIVNQYLAKQVNRRGFLLFNEQTRLKHCIGALFPNAGDVDRLQKASAYGCNVGKATTINGLVEILHKWGVDRVQAVRTIDQYGAPCQTQGNAGLDGPAGCGGSPPASLVDGEGPFYAMEVQPSITFTYGGISIDARGHALTRDDAVVPGFSWQALTLAGLAIWAMQAVLRWRL